MKDSEPDYPDPPIDSNEGGQLVRILREWDQSHAIKSAFLARMAKTEWQFAHATGEAAVEGEDEFLRFVEKTGKMIDEAVENDE